MRDVLKLSTMWNIEDGRLWSIQHLEQTTLDPAIRIQLALGNNIPQWIDAAFTDLLRMKFLDLSLHQIHAIGLDTYIVLSRTSFALETERKYFAAAAPHIGDHIHPIFSECDTHELCQKIWSDVWLTRASRKILHPERPITFSALKVWLEGLPFDGMQTACRLQAITLIDHAIEGEVTLITTAVSKILDGMSM